MQIQYKWDKRHSKILHEYLSILKDRQIEYFILRNYEGLPEKYILISIEVRQSCLLKY